MHEWLSISFAFVRFTSLFSTNHIPVGCITRVKYAWYLNTKVKKKLQSNVARIKHASYARQLDDVNVFLCLLFLRHLLHAILPIKK